MNLVEIAARAIFADQFGGTSDPDITHQFEEHCRETAAVVLSALREAGAIREWRPIEELSDDDAYLFASKDREVFFGMFDIGEECVMVYDGDGRSSESDLDTKFTHFQPLPQPPEEI